MISTGICRWLFLLISLSTWTKLIDSKEMRIVCYYTNWSVYRPGQAKFSPQNINPYLCTHLIYAFGGFTKENTLKPFDKYQDIEKGGYAKFTGLKTYNKNLKTLIAIGGWNEGSSRFSPMVASADRRKELVKNAIKFLRQNHFDGLDLDWEYPTFRDGGKARDRDNYAQLVQELREEFERESEKTGRPRLLLTMAVPAGIEYINKGYDVPKLTKYLDWMNILSYDYHSAFEPAVNHHAPLYPLEEENEYNYDTELNIDYTIKHYLKLGADPSKLVLGIPTYGRSYTLFNPDAYEIGSPADGPGDMGDATRENGYLAYYEICENVKNQDWEVDEPNSEAMGPIAFKDNQWVGYDDENIVRKKAKYVAENALGGIMFWAIDNDDFRGNCHGRPYPLIEAGKEALLNAYGLTEENLISPPSKPTKSSKNKSRTRSGKRTTTTTEIPEEKLEVASITSRRRRIKTKSQTDSNKQKSGESTYSSLKIVTPAYTTPEPPATPDMGGAFKCEDEGFFPHPKDCKKYFWCLSGAGDTGIVAHSFTCPAGLYFNKAADSCDYSQNVLCNKKLQKATATPDKTESSTSVQNINSLFSSSRAPPKITAATSKTTINFKTTTTTEAPEEEYEYIDEEEDALDKKEESEEDPKVIKELIMLIRKAGGIEELEKQITNTKDSSSSADSTTPSAISKSLYESLLSKTSKNTLNALRKTTGNRNSGGPQASGVETKAADRGRPQYKTLSRQRSTTAKTTDADNNEEEKVEEIKEKKSFRTKSSLEYVNIRRPKASTTTEANDNDDGFSRNKILGEIETDDESENEDSEQVTKKTNLPQYVNIRRQRPSTTEPSDTSSKYVLIRRSTTEPSVVDKEIIRRGSTTESTANGGEVTSLRYQTIRRGTTTASTSLVDNEEITIRTRSTTASPISDNIESKYSTIRRSTTTASPAEEEEKLKNNEEPTTVSLLETSEDTKTTVNFESSSTENNLPGTTLQQLNNINSITTETLVSSTYKNTTESNSDSTNSTISSSVESETKKKRPVLFQPRPFGISSTKSTTTTTETPSNPKISTTRPPFRVGYRRRSTTTTPSTSSSLTVAETSTSSPRVTKPVRRKVVPSRNPPTGKPTESQVISTQSPTRITNRFKFVSRKPYFRMTTTKRTIVETTDQNLESTNQDSTENSVAITTEPSETKSSALPQAKPSKKRPQILKLSSRYSSRSTTTTLAPLTTSTQRFLLSPKYSNKKTVAITLPFVTSGMDDDVVYSNTPQSFRADKFASDIVASDPIVREIYESPQTINGQDFITKYVSPRSRSRARSTEAPLILITPGQAIKRRKPSPKAFEKISSRSETKNNDFRPVSDYDYYDSIEASVVGKIPEHSKVLLHSNGIIECLDQGNFPHPVSCKKFISCAKMDNDKIIGWEYTCPKNLSFDPIGGMCNWSAGLGCNEA